MELPAVINGVDVALAYDEITETFAGFAFLRIVLEDRRQGIKDLLLGDVLAIHLIQAIPCKAGSKIEVISARRLACEADLTQIWTSAAIRAAGHTDDDLLFA